MLPPNEIKNKEFSRILRGYNPQEVDEYINNLLLNYNELYTRMKDLERSYDDLYKKYKVLDLDKDTVRNDLIEAKNASERIITEAQEKSELIIRATKTNCDYIIADYRRTVAAEREKLINVQARIQSMKEVLLSECRDYMDAIDRMTEISDTSLYYADDDEMVSKVLSEVKTDVRYAMAEKEQLDTISDEDAKVDLECFNEAVNEEESSKAAESEAHKTEKEKSSEIELAKTVVVPDTSKIGDKYIEFLEELTNDNSDTDKE